MQHDNSGAGFAVSEILNTGLSRIMLRATPSETDWQRLNAELVCR